MAIWSKQNIYNITFTCENFLKFLAARKLIFSKLQERMFIYTFAFKEKKLVYLNIFILWYAQYAFSGDLKKLMGQPLIRISMPISFVPES